MKKMKPIAYEILSLKQEILNDSYPDVVKRALEISVDQMYKNEFINFNTQLMIKDNNTSCVELEKYLKDIPEYIKSREELILEYEKLTEKMSGILLDKGLDRDLFYYNLDIDNDKIKLCNVFSLKEEFLKKYFYFQPSSDEYFDKLMKKKGFIERFAILRLPRIFFNFIDSCEFNNNFKLEKSYPYLDSKSNCYAIDLVFSIPSEVIETDDKLDIITNDILKIIENANYYFEERMSI